MFYFHRERQKKIEREELWKRLDKLTIDKQNKNKKNVKNNRLPNEIFCEKCST